MLNVSFIPVAHEYVEMKQLMLKICCYLQVWQRPKNAKCLSNMFFHKKRGLRGEGKGGYHKNLLFGSKQNSGVVIH